MGNKKILTRNRLSDQTSPYLLQHANNPVDWYPWCEEAFKTAGRRGRIWIVFICQFVRHLPGMAAGP